MDNFERMINGKLYTCNDEKIRELFLRKCEFLDLFNNTAYSDFDTRRELVKKYFKGVGENCNINKPFYCDYASNITLGNNFYANFDCLMLDVAPIIIGDNVMLAPRVCLYTATHPIDSEARNSGLEYAKPITIKNNVWLGGSVVVLPGVTIGNNVVVGAGSVVTKDLEDDGIYVGNPAKLLRKITDKDKDYWQDLVKEYYLDK